MSHIVPSIVEGRCKKLAQYLKKTYLNPQDQIRLSARYARSSDTVAWKDRMGLTYVPIAEGEQWGDTWETAWFEISGTIPTSWAGEEVVLQIDLSGEALVYDAAGCPLVGLTNGSVYDPYFVKELLWLPGRVRGGEYISYWLEAAANNLFGVVRTDPEHNHALEPLHGVHKGKVINLRLCRFDRMAYDLLMDLDILANFLQNAVPQSPMLARVQIALDKAVGVYHKNGAAAARAELAPLFALGVDPGAIRFTGVGHAHIDTAWLWPIAETKRKTARTFASQVGLVERFPGYVFGASQAQLYQFVKDRWPNLYDKVKTAVAKKSWEVQGCMWVEADCNLPSGESLVRQCVLGKRFFKAEFGVDVQNLWLPDVFGYSAQLPQILQKSGVPYFLTQKISWNKVNEFPHNTFVWKGLDGSEVLSHFPPENGYNSRVTPGGLIKAQDRYKERGLIPEVLSLFGIGDGGGGPSEEHLERAKRMHNLNGVPPLRFGHAQPVLERMNAHRSELETWNGELYLELHRGTFTTQAGIKRANRRAEEALHAAELMSASGDLTKYPHQELDQSWKTVLTNQFHDIIPGSSIHKVYEEAVPEDDAVSARCHSLARAAAARLMQADAQACTFVNPSASAFDDLVALPAGWTGASLNGAALEIFPAPQGKNLVRISIAGHRSVVLHRTNLAEKPPAISQAPKITVLENDLVIYRFDAQARLVSAVLKAEGRELMAEPGNALNLYEDRPHAWDAWDIDDQYRMCPVGALVVEHGEYLRTSTVQELRVRGKVGVSAVQLSIRLRSGSTRLDFRTTVDWKERHKLLRVCFPTAIRSDECSYETQYGFVRRPTHRNTSWDAARFEVCGHRWADLSERTRGVALLNDCKYGYSCRSGELGLSLLRAPTEPDPVADLGTHEFTYSLLPHQGDLFESSVRAEAAMLNAGVLSLPGLSGPKWQAPVEVSGEGLELAVVKASEDQGRGIIVRVVEVRGARAKGQITAKGCQIIPTDLMEWKDQDSASALESLDLDVGAFSIETFRILPA